MNISMNDIRLRGYAPDDPAELRRLLRLYQAVEAPAGARQPTTEATLREQLTWPGHEPALDRWVAVAAADPEQLVGYANVFHQTPERSAALVLVHPAWRRRGLGSALLARAVERARARGSTQFNGSALKGDTAALGFMAAYGLAVVGHAWRLSAPEALAVDEPQLPPGYALRSYAEVQDLRLLAEVLNRCYADMWGHAENMPGLVTDAYLAKAMAQHPGVYVPAGMFMVFAPDGRPVGFCRSTLEPTPDEPAQPRTKVVDSPGVAPDHRTQQLQRPLVQAAVRWLSGQARGPYELLSWGDAPETIEIYRGLGFALEEHWIETSLSLEADRRPSATHAA
jgi:mycothiol synthase